MSDEQQQMLREAVRLLDDRASETLWRLAKQPVVGVLARVLSYVTGDEYAILNDRRAER